MDRNLIFFATLSIDPYGRACERITGEGVREFCGILSETRDKRDEEERLFAMIVGIPQELKNNEFRVALVPSGLTWV